MSIFAETSATTGENGEEGCSLICVKFTIGLEHLSVRMVVLRGLRMTRGNGIISVRQVLDSSERRGCGGSGAPAVG